MELDKGMIREILNIGISLTTEKDRNKLLERILVESMNISSADAGTLFVMENGELRFKVMKTISMGISKGADGETIDLPPVALKETNVCAYSAIHNKNINIPDVWNNDVFDFSGPKKYDELTGYYTKSMLMIPMENQEGELIGVMQLINALDEEGAIVPFPKDEEFLISFLASQAASAISNMRYMEELNAQLWSFTEALATAIDERTPYNGSHTRKVAVYAGKVADYFQQQYLLGEYPEGFDTNRKEQLVMGALLHDIGKMVVPLEVMNKSNRLDGRIKTIRERFKLFACYTRIQMLEGKISEKEWRKQQAHLDEILAFVEEINPKEFLTSSEKEKVLTLEQEVCMDPEGNACRLFEEEEMNCLKIQKGTLTDKERKTMENHVQMTAKILSKVHFNRHFNNCARWAVTHHEMLNGTGYPNHLTEKELPLESRILAVTDIYDALTSMDRPYREPMQKEKAFAILYAMVNQGKLDGCVVNALKKCVD